ncbi:MAG: Eco57I restriction-modification methylase domain-containing protein, partial [Candidatus Schekmanbacteria bacterium]|nr:Eco57I restriction-modification methylase domain-containing protein [Candidatus Schekmanbacteria bacterium]
YFYKLPESIRQHAQIIDDKLEAIRVCDPAIGSGAFPVGMMSEIVRARQSLTPYICNVIPNPQNVIPVETGIQSSQKPLDSRFCGNDNPCPERIPYNFKRHAIQESIYGVDLDPGAVEIAKLRLWLSLVVDEEDIRQIKPLPNLDYKIVCGNSLLAFDPGLLNYHLYKELEAVKQQFFDETNSRKKKDEKEKIDRLIKQITNNNKHFSYKAYFSEIFFVGAPLAGALQGQAQDLPLQKNKKSGFDVVIANPPYVRQEAIKAFKDQLKNDFGAFYCGTADLYTYFYKRGLDLLKSGGCLCFITPNKFMRTTYGKNTRMLLIREAMLKTVVDFCELPVFEAGTDPAIVLVKKGKPAKDTLLTATVIKNAEEIEKVSEIVLQRGFPIKIGDLSSEGWTLESSNILSFMGRLRKIGKPLGEYVQGRFYRGVVTGFNDAFVIDAVTRESLISENPASADIIKPWLDGHDIKKWKAEWAGLYVIFTRRGIDIERYPAIKRYLEQFREDLEPKKSDNQKQGRKPGTYKWFEIQDNIAYYEEFEKSKIIFNETSKELHAYVDYKKIFINKTGFIIISPENEYLVGILNSRLMDYYFRHNFPAWGDPWKGGRVQFRKDRMVQVPIVSAPDTQKAPIIERVQAILANPAGQDVPKLEAEINKLVYALYNLTPEEIAIVEGR